MLDTVALVAPANARSKDAERGLLEWSWPSSVTSTKPPLLTASPTVCTPPSSRIANWPLAASKARGTELPWAAANSPAEPPPPSPLPAAASANNDVLASDHAPPIPAGIPANCPGAAADVGKAAALPAKVSSAKSGLSNTSANPKVRGGCGTVPHACLALPCGGSIVQK